MTPRPPLPSPLVPAAPASSLFREGTDGDSAAHQMICFIALIAGEDGVGHMCGVDRLCGVDDRQGWFGS
ncbi:predicted protein [Plenodomus lingam JN3]|uniref:Predicted protein n=1 Tax=Leptosphaeria maculans (strain JN3 / isolate v23.1.3 / race Av1-4-5-6-7-8) TaxID=985895 RepID=E4ZYS0_LEPMJ|nr:predicted protein [Plenodomus lingam JN3]CBX96596.1 predicted protein [Plenodomus lingam JN3]